MKHVKTLGLAVLCASALMAFIGVGTASATELLCAGGLVCKTGTKIAAKSEGKLKLATTGAEVKTIECEVEFGAKTTNEGGAGKPVLGNVEALNFLNCTGVVTVLKKGTFEIYTEEVNNNNNGLLTTSGTEITVEVGGLHCIYNTTNTPNTTIGILTGSATTGGEATIDVNAKLPRTAGKSGVFCGATGTLTGAHK